MSQISVNHTDMNAIFLHRQYHTGLVSVILPCLYAGIKDDHMGLGADILHCQYAEISIYVKGWTWSIFRHNSNHKVITNKE